MYDMCRIERHGKGKKKVREMNERRKKNDEFTEKKEM
jgi:hypothetical protein